MDVEQEIPKIQLVGGWARKVLSIKSREDADWLWTYAWKSPGGREERDIFFSLEEIRQDRDFMEAYCQACVDGNAKKIRQMFSTVKAWDEELRHGELSLTEGDKVIREVQEVIIERSLQQEFPDIEKTIETWRGKTVTQRDPPRGPFREMVRRSFIGCFEVAENDQEAARWLLGEEEEDKKMVTVEKLIEELKAENHQVEELKAESRRKERTLRERIRVAAKRGEIQEGKDWKRIGRTFLIDYEVGQKLAKANMRRGRPRKSGLKSDFS